MDQEPEARPGGWTGWLSNTQTVIEAVTTIIAAISAIVGFVAAQGGVLSVLGEIGLFAVAAYIGAFPAGLILAGLDEISTVMRRHTDDRFFIGAAVVVMITFALLVRFVVFVDGYADDLDTIGQAFLASVGAAALLLPVGLLWYFKGSAPIGR